ncbi:hypothetical protein GE09DRAFT_1225665 [Coniochaeta sp. 2T2.1]|nr:hypothetical protein GE09DRAFT_1225665 [Coniochaeta sp. 2T2.1]
MSHNLDEESPHTDRNTSAQSPPPPTGLLDLPYNIMLELFSTMCTSSQSSQDLIILAATSRQTYTIFKDNERVLFNRAIRSLAKPSTNDTHFNCLMNMAILRTVKQWPVDPADIEVAFLKLPYSRPNLAAIPREHFGSILAYVRSRSPYAPAVDKGDDSAVKEGEFRDRRIQYTLDNGIGQVGHGVNWRVYLEHPFDRFVLNWPEVWRNGVVDQDAYLQEVIWATMLYAEHAAARVSDRERSLFGTEGYVPCCLLEECPRFSKGARSLRAPRLRGR